MYSTFKILGLYSLIWLVVQDEEQAESSTRSIQIVESLLAVTPSPVAPEFYEIYDISYSHMDEPEEDIWIYYIE